MSVDKRSTSDHWSRFQTMQIVLQSTQTRNSARQVHFTNKHQTALDCTMVGYLLMQQWGLLQSLSMTWFEMLWTQIAVSREILSYFIELGYRDRMGTIIEETFCLLKYLSTCTCMWMTGYYETAWTISLSYLSWTAHWHTHSYTSSNTFWITMLIRFLRIPRPKIGCSLLLLFG